MSNRLRSFLFALFLVTTAGVLRWPGLDKVIWNLDEGSTFTMAEIVRNGGVLYRDAADNRTPLVPYLKAGILAIVGDWNIRGAHIVLAVMLGLTAVWLWRLGRRAGDSSAGVFAALYFTLLSFVMLGAVDIMPAHTGWFLIFFSALGMWAFVAALNGGPAWTAAAAGTAFALAGLAKQPGILDGGVCLVVVGLVAWTAPARRRECLRLAGLFAAGFVWPIAATYWYFAAHQAWPEFLRYAWTYNTKLYVPAVPLDERLLGVRMPFQLARENAPFALWLGVLGAGWLLLRALPSLRKRAGEFPVLPWLILGWCASGLVSTVLSGRNFGHYSIQVIPGLSLACGWTTARIWEKSAAWLGRGAKVPGWLMRVIVGAGLLSLTWAAIQRASHFDTSDGIGEDMGYLVKEHTSPEEKIFVWGYEPELHVFAQRLPNTRFIYSVFLTGLIPWTNLDPLINTDYAIVPGAWDAFWHDFLLRPPAMIVDTRGNRGFMKYPLRRQTRLWQIIESQYVEVAVDFATKRGYSVYRRADPVPSVAAALAPTDDAIHVTAPAQAGPGTVRITVDAPAGTAAVDLYVDGHAYRRVRNPVAQRAQVKFFVLGSDLPPGAHWLRAVATGDHPRTSREQTIEIATRDAAKPEFDGPPLSFGGRDILPIESEMISGKPVSLRTGTGQWDAHAPSRLVYLRPDGLTQVDFSFGMLRGAYDGSNAQKTDGVDVVVFFEDDAGRQTEIYKRRVDPVHNAADRMELIAGHAVVPGLSGGKLIFLMTTGPMNNASFDWSYWRNFNGNGSPMVLRFRGQDLAPMEADAKLGVTLMQYGERRVVMVHAPSRFVFRQLPGMNELTGEFGLLDESWRGLQQSAGATFLIEQIHADGKRTELFKRSLYPGNKADDRTTQSFKVALNYSPGDQLSLSTRAANPGNNSFNYTYWNALRTSEFSARIAFGSGEVRSIGSEAPNGLSYMDEGGREVLFAHVPSRLIFPPATAARHLEGKIGLIHGAYTGSGTTSGATFVVELENAGGQRREIFRRFLNPREVPADQGPVPFAVDLPADLGERLVLRTESAPSGRLDFAWSYWQDLQLTP